MRLHQTLPRLLACLVVMAGLVAHAERAAAADLLTNGGFETGDLSGWAGSGATNPFNGAFCPGAGSVAAGICAAFFGPIGANDTLQQTLATQAGASYVVSFSLKAAGDTPSNFTAMWGAQTLFSATSPNTSGVFTPMSFAVTATSASTVLSFVFRDDPGVIFLDAVSVVPEPTMRALFAAGLAGLWLIRRRKAQ